MGKKPFRETHGAVGTFHSFRPLQLCSEIGEGGGGGKRGRGGGEGRGRLGSR